MKKIIIPIFLITITILNAKIIEVEQLFNKKVTTVKKEEISITKDFYANSSIMDDKIIDIVTRFDGYITKLSANKTYMNVKKGEALFSIYSDTIYNIIKDLEIAKDLDTQLYKSIIDKLQVLDINKKEIKRLKDLKTNFKDVTVYSPNDALVLQKNINDKSFVKKGKLLLQLANIDKLWVIAKIYESDLKDIKVGQNVKIFFDGIETPIKSKIDFIYPNTNIKNKTIDIRMTVDNKNKKIYPNMFAKVKVQIKSKTMLTLPKTAVLNKANKYYVFKPISKSEFEPVEVTVKRISSNKYEILDGLQEGQKVINNSLFLLDSDAVTNGLYDNENDEDW
ncbi:cation transporter [Malaciobacter molluscorum]|uniref:efflux RND transporter periplasmic adaptor subunit n=1 Tax=Malaciobacter molluscorum TaxID=1032072 RepID=UPI00100BCD53|nr:HlyD family efflux transporter periplasmic adaptor subunit [Malaciobacter molluscorum]RXJ93726.1 cation transporter [Malaciobacter molluscorum]